MRLGELMKVLSMRIIYDILDSQTGKLIKWKDINYNYNNDFYKKYGNREVELIAPLNKDTIEYYVLIKLKKED